MGSTAAIVWNILFGAVGAGYFAGVVLLGG